MKKRRGVWRAVTRAIIGIMLFVGVGAGVRAMLERTPWTRTVTYYEPDVSSTIPAIVSTSTIIKEEAPVEPVPEPLPAPTPILSVSDTSIEQSDTFGVAVSNIQSSLPATATWGDRTYDLIQFGGRLIGLLGADAKTAPGSYEVVVNAGTTTLRKSVSVAKRTFPMTVLTVTPELEEQGYNPPAIQSNVATENARLNSALIYRPAALFSETFVNPLGRMSIVGAYGNIRKSGAVELQHLGADLDADEGTPVYSINDGVVNLVESFTNYGNTIVVDHGVGIFSFYLHLSEFNVKVGDKVTRGQIIAKSGNTGYSIAPHLHFSVRIRNASVDPLRFIETANEVLTLVP